MPWKETHVLEERIKFVLAFHDACDGRSMTELCRDFRISRKTGYKTLLRHARDGVDGLKDRSRAPLTHPNETPLEVVDLIVAERVAHPNWGPKKLLPLLKRRHPEIARWPAVSTAGDILKRRGLVAPGRKRRRTPPFTRPFSRATRPNDLWCADHKGFFRTKDGARCDPLTVSDSTSRFLLTLKATSSTSVDEAWPHIERAFREFGLPAAIRTDNGSPFASNGLGGLTRMTAWWVRLGIVPERIQPGHPEQNGRHERIHLTMDKETLRHPRSNLGAQQRAFNRFRTEYNEVRPHEALDFRTPAELYERSHRPYSPRPPEIEYPPDFEVRRIRNTGAMKWKGNLVYVSEALAGQAVGMKQIAARRWSLHFSFIELGVFDENALKIRRNRPAHLAEDRTGDGKRR